MWYSQAINDHACQNSECEYKEGFKKSSLLFDIYESTYRFTFKNHPNIEFIMEGFKNGSFSADEIDNYFAEAGFYTHKKLQETVAKIPVNEDGTVTFKFHKAKDD